MLLALLIIGMMWRQAARGEVDLLSVRNFFLVGFIIFQVTATTVPLLTGEYHDCPPPGNVGKAATIYLFILVLFLVFFLMLYKHGLRSERIAYRLVHRFPAIGLNATLILAAVILGFAIPCRFIFIRLPFIGANFMYLSVGFFALAAGLAAWAWAPRLMNIAVAFPAAAIIGIAGLGSMSQSFGRRFILGVLIACIWGAYHSAWQHLGFRQACIRLMIVGMAGVALLASYTSVRNADFRDLSGVGVAKALAGGNIKSGVLNLLSGQYAPAFSMWLIEERFESKQYDLLHSVKLVLTLPIPRSIYPDKPEGLAITIPRELNVRKKAKEYNVGPGLVGHIVNDNPWISFIPYVLILAFSIRLLDNMTTYGRYSSLAIMPCGVAIGQIIALPRGELGTFFAAATIATAGSYLIMLFARGVFRRLNLTQEIPDAPAEDQPEYVDDQPYGYGIEPVY